MQITEYDKLQDQWYEEAKSVTLETLSDFISKLVNEYGHDYGTVCHAIAASALAAAHAVNGSKIGGITGFQAGAVMWQFIMQWMYLKNEPLSLIQYSEMLYPQYFSKFHSISEDTWEYLQKEANRLLQESKSTNINVIKHWQSIADGIVPFEYYVDAQR